MVATTSETSGSRAQPEAYFDHFWETKPGTLGGRYLRQFWHPVCRSVELLPGRAKPIRLMSEDFTLYRGESGTAHLTVHRCPHRKTQLSVGFVEGDAIRCMYHGWKFGKDGRCVERPGDGTTGSIAIDVYPVEEYLGLIFVYVGEGKPPVFPPYPQFAAAGLNEIYVAFFPCNHFQSYENDWDLFHAAYTHRTGEIHGPSSGPGRNEFFLNMVKSEEYDEMDFGVVRRLKAANGQTYASIFLMPLTIRLLIPTFNEQSRRTGPQLRETYLIHTPIDDENHLVFLTQNVPVTGEDAVGYQKEYQRIESLKKGLPTPWKRHTKSCPALRRFRTRPATRFWSKWRIS